MEPFPTLPVYDHQAWTTDLNILEKPGFKELKETFVPFVYFEISPPDQGRRSPADYNRLLQDFLTALDPKNDRKFPDHIRKFNSEGGIGNIYFPDEFMLFGDKVFCYDAEVDQNWPAYTGIVIRNHFDMRSRIYEILRIAFEFSIWLTGQKIPHKVFLRKIDAEENTEVEVRP